MIEVLAVKYELKGKWVLTYNLFSLEDPAKYLVDETFKGVLFLDSIGNTVFALEYDSSTSHEKHLSVSHVFADLPSLEARESTPLHIT